MITVTMKNGEIHANMGKGADRDGLVLLIYDEDGLIAEFNDTWSHWYEHDKKIESVRKEE